MASKQQVDPFYLSIPPWWSAVSHSLPSLFYSFSQPALPSPHLFPGELWTLTLPGKGEERKGPQGRRTGTMETKPSWFYIKAIFKGLGKFIPTSLRLGVLIIDKVQNKFTFFSITLAMQRVTHCNHRLNYKHAWVFTVPILSELSGSLFRYHLFENAALIALTAFFGKAYLFKCKISG